MRAAAPAEAPPEQAQVVTGNPRRKHQVRLALLILIPIVAIGAAVILINVVESRPAAGLVLLLGCALWITTFAVDLGEDIPPRDRFKFQGLNFGRKN